VRKLLVPLALALGFAAPAHASGPLPPRQSTTPQHLTAFLLRATEAENHVFPRTPSFAWTPIPKAGHYEFQIATTRSFADAAVIFADDKVASPAEAVPLQLPWMTGQPYALWAHVRFVGKDGKTSPWSTPFGFNMRWRDTDIPTPLDSPAGLVRWTPVEGATAYDVLYPDQLPARSFQTTTNVADEREFFTFHSALGLGAIRWRVRAVRYIDDTTPIANGLPRVSYGPWSPTFTTVNPPASLGALTPSATVSDTYSKLGSSAKPHELTPAFAWDGDPGVLPGVVAGSPLYRVYVFTDDHCVNQVFAGAIVGSPAYAPRSVGGPLTLPQDTDALATFQGGAVKLGGGEGNAYDATGDKVVTNETPGKSLDGTSAGSTVAGVDLWDSGWPNGRFYWTVVPVSVLTIGTAKPPAAQPIEYHEISVPQDACEAGQVMSFGKVSQPVVAASSTPYASGLSPNGRVIAAVGSRPSFHDSPLVAWEPAVGATSYEVEWAKGTTYPWKATGSLTTHATSVVLPLKEPGLWFYRVRGINPALPAKAQKMTWSRPAALRLTGTQFKIVK